MSPSRNSTFGTFTFALFSFAFCIITSVISTPITFPVDPTYFDAMKQSIPAPDPRSSTVIPSFRSANAAGVPHPKPRSAPSGIACLSASL